MTYKELLENIQNLGFGDADEMEEFGSIVPNAINRAITEISLNYAPIIGTFDIYHGYQNDGTLTSNFDTKKIYEYSIDELASDFLDFSQIPVKRMLNQGVYERFSDYELEGSSILLRGSDVGIYRVLYVKAHTPVTTETGDSVDLYSDIGLPQKAHHLVPLLASYYVWLDDDPTKAQQYKQAYDVAYQIAKTEEKPRGRIVTEWGV